MRQFKLLDSTIAVLDIENIDTDQIIGSDHLKITIKEGLGKHLFSDWRYANDGTENKEFVLNQSLTRTSRVLVTGDNFGCGSSREHAPWALLDHGIEVIISSSIADIFSNNAIKNGLLPIKVSKQQQSFLLAQNGSSILIDLENKVIHCAGERFEFSIEPFARFCLLNGIEQMDFLMKHASDIESFENKQQGLN